MPTPNDLPLKQRVVMASFLVLVSNISRNFIRLISNLILTRFLVPEMFGIMAIASSIIIGVGLLSDIGLRENVIKSSQIDRPDFLNTTWTIKVVRGILLAAIIIFMAVLIYFGQKTTIFPAGSAFTNAVLPAVVLFLSLSPLIHGFESTKVFTADRMLALGRLTIIEIVSQLIGLFLMIVWVIIDPVIWALVVGAVAPQLIRVLMSHMFLPGQSNHFAFNRTHAIEIVNFGKWILLGTAFTFLGGYGLVIIQGFLLTEKTIGFISIADAFSLAAITLVTQLVSKIAFPVLSDANRIGQNRLIVAVHEYQLKLLLLSIPLLLALSLISQPMIAMLYDQRYEIVGHYLAIMALNGAVSILPMLYQSAFISVGETLMQFNFTVFTFFSRLVGMLLGYRLFGVDGLLLGIGVANLLNYAYIANFTHSKSWLHMKVDLPFIFIILLGYYFTFFE